VDSRTRLAEPDTVWHTRGERGQARQAPSAPRARPARRELPPSRVPRMLLWALLLAVLAWLASTVMRVPH